MISLNGKNRYSKCSVDVYFLTRLFFSNFEIHRDFSLYFMAILPEGEVSPTPGTPEAEKYLWNFKGLTLELTHNYGSEKDDKSCSTALTRELTL